MFSALLGNMDRLTVDTFGQAVTYSPGSGPAVEVTGVFDAVYIKIDAGNAGLSSQSPAVLLLLADLPSDPSEDLAARVTVGSITYRAHEVEVDGKGLALLLLNEV